MLTDFLYAYTYDNVNALESFGVCLNIAASTFIQKKLITRNIRNIRETFDSINSAIEQELCDRRVEGRANATSCA